VSKNVSNRLLGARIFKNVGNVSIVLICTFPLVATRFLYIMLYRVLDINEFIKASLSLLSCVVRHRDTRFQTPLSAGSIGPSAAESRQSLALLAAFCRFSF
jgi:hypothetical protein